MNRLYNTLSLLHKGKISKETFYTVGDIVHVRQEWVSHGGNGIMSKCDWYDYHDILCHEVTGCKYCINDDIVDDDGYTMLFEWCEKKKMYMADGHNYKKVKIK